jgi:hypothetical protein
MLPANLSGISVMCLGYLVIIRVLPGSSSHLKFFHVGKSSVCFVDFVHPGKASVYLVDLALRGIFFFA